MKDSELKMTDTRRVSPKLMIISREPPELVEARLRIEAQDVIWVTHFLRADVVSPNNLDEIARRIRFFSSKNKNGIVILTDFGFLMKNNDRQEIKLFLHSVSDGVSASNMLFVLKQTSSSSLGIDISSYGLIYLGVMVGGQWSVFSLNSVDHLTARQANLETVLFKSHISSP